MSNTPFAPNTILIIDGYNLIFRSYFAFIANPLRNDRGENTSAIFGFFRTIAALIREYRPAELCIALDPIGKTFRHKRYPEYKGTRARTPDDLKAQIPRIEAIIAAMNIPVVRVDEYEADDVIASLVRRYTTEGRECVILSADKDLMQLVGERVRMLKPHMRSHGFDLLDAEGVQASKGVRPEQIADYLALLGDASDNIPGVSGIGEKTAVRLLAEYNTLAQVYENVEHITPPSRKERLLAGRESAWLSRELVTLVASIEIEKVAGGYPIALTPENATSLLKAENINSIAVEYRELVRGDGAGDGAGEGAQEDNNLAATSDSGGGKYADRYRLLTTIAEVEGWMERVRAHGVCAFDTETTSLDPMQAIPVGMSFAVDNHAACYIPLRGPEGAQVLGEDEVRGLVKPLLEDQQIKIVGQNIKYDIKVMARWGVAIQGVVHDTMIAAWLLDVTAHSYKLDVLAQKYLDYQTIPYPESAKKDGFISIALEEACVYAAEDADITYALYRYFDRRLKKDPVQYRLYTEVEIALIPILAEMEITGIRVNRERLTALKTQLTVDLEALRNEIHALNGEEFNIQSTKVLQEILFTKLKLNPIKKTKTGYSTDTSVLTMLSTQHPLPGKILEYRVLSKMLSTYVEALPQLIHPQSGRIHTTFSIIGTNTGRISSANPNLQNIPVKDEQGRKIRQAFVADDGCSFVSADYSQIELVVFAHLSRDPEMRAALTEKKDIHALTAVSVFGGEINEVNQQQRRMAKAINFGVMYGMSAFRLSRELSIPLAEARRFIEQYFEQYAGVKRYIRETIESACETGYVQTLLGRRRAVPEITSKNQMIRQAAERIAINTPIQGSAADIIKLAMRQIHKKFSAQRLKSSMLLQVHDELVIEAWADEEQQVISILEKEMTTAYPLSVPLRVSINSGRTWGGLK